MSGELRQITSVMDQAFQKIQDYKRIIWRALKKAGCLLDLVSQMFIFFKLLFQNYEGLKCFLAKYSRLKAATPETIQALPKVVIRCNRLVKSRTVCNVMRERAL